MQRKRLRTCRHRDQIFLVRDRKIKCVRLNEREILRYVADALAKDASLVRIGGLELTKDDWPELMHRLWEANDYAEGRITEDSAKGKP